MSQEFNPDDWQNCPEREHRKPHRTFGANIPYYAQGAVFPGDEGGDFCKITDQKCTIHPYWNEDCPLRSEEE